MRREDFIDVRQLAASLDVSPASIYQRIHTGQLDIPFIMKGKRYLFAKDSVFSVDEWPQATQNTAP